jgi:uncharacterized protein (DUF2336 family)
MNANRPMTELLPPPSFAKPDIVRRFLAWAQSAGADARAEGASALARAYLYSELAAPVRAEAALAMTALLDDPSVLVRRALAEALCHSSEAPRPLILALATDEPDVAAAVLRRSPVLTDADLVDCAANGDAVAQTALARRPNLPGGATALLIEGGQRETVLALIANPEIDLPAESLSCIFARFDDDTSVREALLERPFLPPSLRARIAVAAAKDLAVEASQWMPRERAERIAREARDQAICSIFPLCERNERTELLRALRAAGALTPALLMRSLLGGEPDLFAEALAQLSGLPPPRVAAFILEPQGEGFAALAHRAGLKSGILPAFRAALAAMKTHGGEAGYGLKLSLVHKVIDECERRDNPALTKVLALLWRFAAEAARAEAASFAREAAMSASPGRLQQILDFSPVNDDGASQAPKLMADFHWPSEDPTPPLGLAAPAADASDDRASRIELPRESSGLSTTRLELKRREEASKAA